MTHKKAFTTKYMDLLVDQDTWDEFQFLPLSQHFSCTKEILIDLLALWSTINPSSYVIPQKKTIGIYSEVAGTVGRQHALDTVPS
jgi:hypothetical protein